MILRAWLSKRFHPSYGLGWLAFGLLIGLGLSRLLSLHLPVWSIALLLVITIWLLFNARLAAYLLIILIAISIGWSRGSTVDSELNDLRSSVGHTITIKGVVAEDPSISPQGDMRLIINQISLSEQAVRGMAWVTLRDGGQYGRGDYVSLSGKAKEGFGPYSISMSGPQVNYLQVVKSPIRQLRETFSQAVRQYIVEPSASLGLGFVIGQRSSLPAGLDDQLRAVGLTHMVVASGYNLTILVRFAKRSFEKRSKYLTAIISIGLMLSFIAVSGASPSMVRAGLVTGLSVLAWYYGRRFHPLLLIVYVMAMTAMYDPMYLWADIGWWLSFLAFAGVLMLAPLVSKWIYRKGDKPGSVLQIAIETSAAQIMTLPLIILTFSQLPLLAVLANILAAPFVPLAMLLTFVAGMGTALVPLLGPILALPAEVILSYFVALVGFLAEPSWAMLDVKLDSYSMLIVFGVIIISGLILWRRLNYSFRSTSVID